MKCLILIILSVIVSFTAHCQFILTPIGFVDSTTMDKNYIVYEFPSLTQKQISDKVNYYLSTVYRSPKDALSKVDSSLIKVNGFCEQCVGFDINYNISFRFKQGKLRIDSPIFELTTSLDSRIKVVLVKTPDILGIGISGIYNKNLVLKMPKVHNALETYFNDYMHKLVSSIEGNNENDTW
jgi:hypothetical protein